MMADIEAMSLMVTPVKLLTTASVPEIVVPEIAERWDFIKVQD